jgi:type IX secretion system PorP/SprF family membrane protein
MKTTSLILSLCCTLFCTSLVHAQDIHFSQFFASPLNTNPANAGNFEGDYRVAFNNKNQWNTFTNAFTTFAGSFDTGFSNLFFDGSKAGVGIQLNNDMAGDGKLGTSQFYLNASYYFPIDKNKQFNLGLAFCGGYVIHGINFNNLTFGNQYSGEQFDPNLPAGEAWAYDKISYPDFGSGFNLIYNYNPKLQVQAGFSVMHINSPGKSFYEDSDAYLPIKYTINATGEYNLKDDLWVEPQFLAMLQQDYREYNIGALMRFDYNPVSLQSIYFGALVRTRDAGIVVFGLKYHNVRMSLNYDINLSKLSTISRGKGGVEFSIIYIFLKPRPFESPYYRKCPDFI